MLIIVSLFSINQTEAQNTILWESVGTMPEPLANNAVVGATVGGEEYVYSFTGIGPDLDHESISLAAWRYHPSTDTWLELPDVPDTLGVVAAGASEINGKIYLIGGYHVLPSGAELSSNRVQIFDTQTNLWEPGGAVIPVPIDDHIQAVWNDSLIYIVTGWSNSGNVSDVQIYDPVNDSWSAGTPVPSIGAPSYRVFGGSGVIINNSIYYAGGARSSGFSFVLGDGFRIGEIDSSDPTVIDWQTYSDDDALNYRSAATVLQQQDGLSPVWIGGSDVAYNFDAVAYNGSGVVSPNLRITRYSVPGDSVFDRSEAAPPVMDLRGIAVFENRRAYTMGGITDLRQVDGAVWRYDVDGISGLEEPTPELRGFKAIPTITDGLCKIVLNGAASGQDWTGASWHILDLTGRIVQSGIWAESSLGISTNSSSSTSSVTMTLDLTNEVAGIYLWKIQSNSIRSTSARQANAQVKIVVR